ncbi:Auxin-responsive protein SAUR50 [Linum grandiflorum]
MKLKKVTHLWHKEAGEGGEKKLPRDVPPGHLPVMVGEAGKRFVIKADHLNHPILRKLLDQAYEEHGHNNNGLLSIPCDEPSFRDIIHSLTVGAKILPSFHQVPKKLRCTRELANSTSWQ